jgi:hypothetical protein
MVDFSINGIKISILLTKFSLLIPLNLGGISIKNCAAFKKSSIGPEIRSASSAIKKDEFRLLKSKFYWEKSSNR